MAKWDKYRNLELVESRDRSHLKPRSEYFELLAKLLEEGYTLVWFPHGNGLAEHWRCHHPREYLHCIAPTVVMAYHYERRLNHA